MKDKLLLLPDDSSDLASIYNRAMKNGAEIYIATAFLTSWAQISKPNRNCINFKILCGTGFGLTKKDALKKVLKWLPSQFKNELYASTSGSSFHPKILAWKESNGTYYVLAGSSNLTIAGLNKNLEVNILKKINEKEWLRLESWINDEIINASIINESWIDDYVESDNKSFSKGKGAASNSTWKPPKLFKPKKAEKHLKGHLKQMRTFEKIKNDYLKIIEKCAVGKISNEDFYNQMYKVRVHGENIFQRPTWRIACKNCNWKEVCQLIVSFQKLEKKYGSISKKNEDKYDQFLKIKLDELDRMGNPSRSAWLSEQLCQFYPNYYPLVNGALRPWLKNHKLPPARGASFGAKYIHLTKVLRKAIRSNESEISNFVELDAVAWTFTNT